MAKADRHPKGSSNLYDFLKWVFDPERPSRLVWFLFGVVVIAKVTDIAQWNWSTITIVGALGTAVGQIRKMIG